MSTKSAGTSHVLITLGALFSLGGATRMITLNYPNAAASAETGGEPAAGLGRAQVADDAAVEASLEKVCFSAEQAAAIQQDQWLFEEELEALDDQRIELAEWEAQLEEQTQSLSALQDVLDKRWQEMQLAADEDIKHLAKMYSAMKPKEAAAIFDRMDASFGAGFLRLMPSDQAGKILAEMNPDRAYTISAKIASKNSDVRRQNQ